MDNKAASPMHFAPHNASAPQFAPSPYKTDPNVRTGGEANTTTTNTFPGSTSSVAAAAACRPVGDDSFQLTDSAIATATTTSSFNEDEGSLKQLQQQQIIRGQLLREPTDISSNIYGYGDANNKKLKSGPDVHCDKTASVRADSNDDESGVDLPKAAWRQAGISEAATSAVVAAGGGSLSLTAGKRVGRLLATNTNANSGERQQQRQQLITVMPFLRLKSFDNNAARLNNNNSLLTPSHHSDNCSTIAPSVTPGSTSNTDTALCSFARSLYYLKGCTPVEVAGHIISDEELKQIYLNLHNFSGLNLEIALRQFTDKVCLLGTAQQKVDLLERFAQRFFLTYDEEFEYWYTSGAGAGGGDTISSHNSKSNSSKLFVSQRTTFFALLALVIVSSYLFQQQLASSSAASCRSNNLEVESDSSSNTDNDDDDVDGDEENDAVPLPQQHTRERHAADSRHPKPGCHAQRSATERTARQIDLLLQSHAEQTNGSSSPPQNGRQRQQQQQNKSDSAGGSKKGGQTVPLVIKSQNASLLLTDSTEANCWWTKLNDDLLLPLDERVPLREQKRLRAAICNEPLPVRPSEEEIKFFYQYASHYEPPSLQSVSEVMLPNDNKAQFDAEKAPIVPQNLGSELHAAAAAANDKAVSEAVVVTTIENAPAAKSTNTMVDNAAFWAIITSMQTNWPPYTRHMQRSQHDGSTSAADASCAAGFARRRLKFYLFFMLLLLVRSSHAYYDTYQTFGTPQGETQIYTLMQEGGFNDPNYRWLTECQDQEALWGILDFTDNYEGFQRLWCKNVFPMKPPSGGLYPYYPYCTFRDQTRNQYFCFDQRDPVKTYDTFVTGFYDAVDEELSFDPVGMKCCHTPPGYHIDYSGCYYKYTHDADGEHYRDYMFWLVVCDSAYHVTVGVGQALNPWDREFHYTWIQCCPVIYVGAAFESNDVIAITLREALSIPMGTLDYANEIYSASSVPFLASIGHDSNITAKYGYADDADHNVKYPNISSSILSGAAEKKEEKHDEEEEADMEHQRAKVPSPVEAAKTGQAAEYGDRHRAEAADDDDKYERRKREAMRDGLNSSPALRLQPGQQQQSQQPGARRRRGRAFGARKAPPFRPPTPTLLGSLHYNMLNRTTLTTATMSPVPAPPSPNILQNRTTLARVKRQMTTDDERYSSFRKHRRLLAPGVPAPDNTEGNWPWFSSRYYPPRAPGAPPVLDTSQLTNASYPADFDNGIGTAAAAGGINWLNIFGSVTMPHFPPPDNSVANFPWNQNGFVPIGVQRRTAPFPNTAGPAPYPSAPPAPGRRRRLLMPNVPPPEFTSINWPWNAKPVTTTS